MTRTQSFLVLLVYVIGIYACVEWSLAEGCTALLGFLLWTSFFAFSNAVGWAIYWWAEANC